MSSRYYLPLHHDAVVKYVFRAHIKKNNPGAMFKDNSTNSSTNPTNMDTGGTSR